MQIPAEVDIGGSGEDWHLLLLDGSVVDVDPDVVKGLFATQQCLVNHSSWAILAPPHAVLSQHHFAAVLVHQHAPVRIPYPISGLVQLISHDRLHLKPSAINQQVETDSLLLLRSLYSLLKRLPLQMGHAQPQTIGTIDLDGVQQISDDQFSLIVLHEGSELGLLDDVCLFFEEVDFPLVHADYGGIGVLRGEGVTEMEVHSM